MVKCGRNLIYLRALLLIDNSFSLREKVRMRGY